MGQTINVSEPTVIGKVALFDTDRTLSGQDGETYRSANSAADAATFPAGLATSLFAIDGSISTVYVYSNVASVERTSGWDEATLRAVSRAISNFFVVYDENKAV